MKIVKQMAETLVLSISAIIFPSIMPKYRRSKPYLAARSVARSGNHGRLYLEQKSSFSSKGVFTYAERENGDRRKT